MSASSSEPTPPKKRRWVNLAMRLVGVLLLIGVVANVGWRDSVRLKGGEVVSGTIVGDVPTEWGSPDAKVRFERAEDGASPEDLGVEDLDDELIGDQRVPVVDEGLIRILRRSDLLLLLAGLLAFGFSCHFGIYRWFLLLRAQDIKCTFWETHRLTFLGMFFNNVVPGATGGDLVKAVYIARRTDKRAAAVVTVLIDRVTGIIALAAIAGIVLLFNLDDRRYRELAIFVFLFLGVVGFGAALFFSRRVRRLVRFDQIASKLPGSGLIKKVDEAIFLYRYQKSAVVWAMVLSFLNQYAIQFISMLFGAALHVTYRSGEAVTMSDYLVALPVGFMISAVPVMPGGWGIRETAFAACFYFIGVDRNPAVALSVVIGFNMLLWSTLGGVYFLQRRGAKGQDPELDAQSEDGAEPEAPDEATPA